MPRQFPLQSLLDLSTLRLDEATRRLGELIAGEQEAAKRHGLLVEYREEYQARFVAAAEQGLSPREWANFRNFLDRLDEAIGQASRAMDHSRQRTAAGQQDWLAKRGKVKAFDTLSDRHRVREDTLDRRKTQKESDDRAARDHGEKAGPDGGRER